MAPDPSADLRDNAARHRFERDLDGETAFVSYRLSPGLITLNHTEVPQQFSGRGIGSALVRDVLDIARTRGLRVLPTCPFISTFIARNPQYRDLLA